MQGKRRRNDFASTEVGEVKGGRVTQQAFEGADKKDSGISDAAMPGTRGDERKDADSGIDSRSSASFMISNLCFRLLRRGQRFASVSCLTFSFLLEWKNSASS